MVTCSQCGTEQPDGMPFCDNCGAALNSPAAQGAGQGSQLGAPTAVASNACPTCGVSVPPGEEFCPNCGVQLSGGAADSGAGSQSFQSSQPQPSAFGGGSPAAGSGQLTCPSCGAQLEPDSAFCDMCGTRLDEAAQSSSGGQPTVQDQQQAHPPQPTWQSQDSRQSSQPNQYGDRAGQPRPQQTVQQPGQNQWAQQQPQPPAQPGMASQARLVVQGSNATLPFPPGRTQVTIGREDPVSGFFPDVDLTDHGGDEAGVSRKHAQITIESGQFYIEDLNSVNYTFVNRQKIMPGQRQLLNNGDEIRLGALKLTFQRM